MNGQPLTIRAATPDDAGTLRRLAELDGATPLAGPVLLAELDGMPVAAAPLETGSVAADPCQHSADAVQMLMLRRYQPHAPRPGTSHQHACSCGDAACQSGALTPHAHEKPRLTGPMDALEPTVPRREGQSPPRSVT